MTTAPLKLKVDVTSDVICPYCIVGVKQLENAIDIHNKSQPDARIEPEISFYPFLLRPDLTSEEPTDLNILMRQKFGAQLEGLTQRVTDAMAKEGYTRHNDIKVSSPHLAHRLAAYALDKVPERQSELSMDLLKSYHVDGIHPSDRDVLAKLAVKNGVFDSEDKAKEWLKTDEYDAQVKQDYRKAQQQGISGVPFFVFDNKYAASGAMGTETFVDIIGQLSKKLKEESKATSIGGNQGPVCDDGVCAV